MDRKTGQSGIHIAEIDADIERCYAVMAELRPQVPRAGFVPQVRRQMLAGYRLAFVEDKGNVVAAAGFRLGETLFHGRFMYVDDLVTTAAQRSRGQGRKLFQWLVQHAREHGCTHLDLDSGVQRFEAHRFYLRQGMQIRSHHFSLELNPGGEKNK
jgi:GNAT superfamily N-acetyltransferase